MSQEIPYYSLDEEGNSQSLSYGEAYIDDGDLKELLLELLGDDVSQEEIQKILEAASDENLSEEEFDGKFFAGREVNLQGLGEGDVNIVKWVITQTDKNGFTTSKETEGASCTFTMPDCNRIAVNAYIGSANGISTISSHTWQWQYSDNKVIVSNTDVGTSVSLYNLQGIRLWRATSNGADVALPANGKQPYILQVGDERIKISL